MICGTIHLNKRTYLKEEYEEELALLKVSLPDLQEIPVIPFAKVKEIVARIEELIPRVRLFAMIEDLMHW